MVLKLPLSINTLEQKICICKIKTNTHIKTMSIEQVSDSSFKQSVIDNSNNQPVLVDFWAEWCGPCKALGPILENVSVEFEGKVAVKKVNIDENPEAPANFGIRSIPTMILFKNGSIADTKIGLSSEADLKNWLNSHL